MIYNENKINKEFKKRMFLFLNYKASITPYLLHNYGYKFLNIDAIYFPN